MKGQLTLVAVLVGASLFAGCGSNKKTTQSPAAGQSSATIAENYQGVWVSSAYADALVVKENSVDYYKYTSDYCVLQTSYENLNTSELTRSVELTTDETALTWIAGYGTKDFGAPSRNLDKQTELPASCTDQILTPESSLTNSEMFELYTQIMDEYYLDFSRNNVDWTTLSYELSNTVTENDETLYEAIFTSFEALADTHNKWNTATGETILSFTKQTHLYDLVEEYATANGLSYPLDGSEFSDNTLNDINNYIDQEFAKEQNIITSYATTDIGIDQSEQIYWFAINNIGYLHINGMTGYSTVNEDQDDLAQTSSALSNLNEAIDEALSDLSETSGLIIDVRYNGGGNDYISLAIASRFTEAEFLAYKKYARDGAGVTETIESTISPSGFVQYTGKPVVLLISEDTASAAETFSLSMTQLDHVTLVGEATQGIFSDVLEWALPGGHSLGMSNEYYVTPNDEWLEGVGVPADVVVPFFAPQDRENQKDSGILAALDILQ